VLPGVCSSEEELSAPDQFISVTLNYPLSNGGNVPTQEQLLAALEEIATENNQTSNAVDPRTLDVVSITPSTDIFDLGTFTVVFSVNCSDIPPRTKEENRRLLQQALEDNQATLENLCTPDPCTVREITGGTESEINGASALVASLSLSILAVFATVLLV